MPIFTRYIFFFFDICLTERTFIYLYLYLNLRSFLNREEGPWQRLSSVLVSLFDQAVNSAWPECSTSGWECYATVPCLGCYNKHLTPSAWHHLPLREVPLGFFFFLVKQQYVIGVETDLTLEIELAEFISIFSGHSKETKISFNQTLYPLMLDQHLRTDQTMN